MIRRYIEPARDRAQADGNVAVGLWRKGAGSIGEATCHDPRRHGRLELEPARQRAGGGLCLSAVSYLERVEDMRDQRELRLRKPALTYWAATVVHLDTPISARAMFPVGQCAPSDAMQFADALIAVTASECGLDLLIGNVKRYRPVGGLVIRVYRP